MRLTRALRWGRWLGGLLLLLLLPILIVLATNDWNWLRGPIERMVTEKSGRVLSLGGDLTIRFGWPSARVRASGLSFANPPWASHKQMVTADDLEFAIELWPLLRREVIVRELRLVRPVVFLEQSSDGRKNWLLDVEQRDENARVDIDRLALDHGRIGYDDPRRKTHIEAEISTADLVEGNASARAVVFTASGRYRDLPFQARGTGGPILALRDTSTPYPLSVDATIGRSRVEVNGKVTGLAELTAVDTHLALRGESLADLFPVLGIALPETPAYRISGQLTHKGKMWRYEDFAGRIGGSDIAGVVQVDGGGKRPFLRAELKSRVLNFADLGPVIGAEPAAVLKARGKVLPEIPFRAERWASVDADVKLSADSIRRPEQLPIDDLVTHLKLNDAVLSLDPLNFTVAGGKLTGAIALDGRQPPIQARLRGQLRKISLAKLFPTIDQARLRSGRIDGNFELAGRGNSVAQQLGSADGNLTLIMEGGVVSRLLLEAIGLHLWEMLQLTVGGDETSAIRCGVAEFKVKDGVMTSEAIVLDTDVTTVNASGTIDLRSERLDLQLSQRTKSTSPVALRGPIHVRGSFAKPQASVATGQVAARSLGAVALGLINPLAALLPLVETGPGADSDCAQLIRQAEAPPSSKPGGKRAPARPRKPG